MKLSWRDNHKYIFAKQQPDSPTNLLKKITRSSPYGLHIRRLLIVTLILLAIAVSMPFDTQAQSIDLNCRAGGLPVPCLRGAQGPAGRETVGQLIASVLQILLALAGAIAVLFLIIGGVRYIAAQGNEESAEAAKKTLTNALIGLAAIILAFAIVRVISNLLITGRVGP